MNLQALRRCPVFDVLADDEVAVIAALGALQAVPAGHTVFEQGARSEDMYVIVEGRVEVVYNGQVTAELSAGDFFGEMAMFNRAERVATVRAVEDSQLLAIPDRQLQPLVLRQEPAAVKLVQQLGGLTLERVKRLDLRLGEHLASDLPALAAAFGEYQQLKRQLLAAWSLTYHALGKPGKLEVRSTKPSATAEDLSVAYSPGVAEPCLAIRDDPDAAYTYTNKGHLVGVLSNGTAVLGLGSIGALASKPVMEGKAVLLKRFADVDAIDIEIDTSDAEAFVQTVVHIACSFGGINLEDIAAPDCFWIESECQRRLDIPVMHDDQHGTAIIVGAALRNAVDLVGKQVEDLRVVLSGAGAAGFATARFLLALGVRRDNLVLTDIDGVVYVGRPGPSYLQELASETDLRTLAAVIADADVFVGVSAAGVLTPQMLRSMAPDPIVFALANPMPEIDPDLARQHRPDVVVATGRSDHPNQVNNVLAFPYLFRGALDTRASCINEEMKHAAAAAIADLARQPVTEEAGFDGGSLEFGRNYLIPKPFDRRLLPHVATAVAGAALRSGVARLTVDLEEYRVKLNGTALL